MDLPVYYMEDAAQIVFENISAALQEKLSIEEIEIILDIEFEFQKQSGLTDNPNSIVQLPKQIDEAALEYFIIHESTKEDIYLTFEEVQEILDAETIYLKSLGLIDDEGLAPFYN